MKNKFVLFAQGRTGSNLLRSLLNCHQDVRCDAELLNGTEKHFRPSLALDIIKLNPGFFMNSYAITSKQDCYGFKFSGYQVKKPDHFIHYLYSRGWKIICLSRANVLDQAVSFISAIKRGKWLYRRGEPTVDMRLKIGPQELLDQINWIEQNNIRDQKILKNLYHYSLVYEKHLKDPVNWSQNMRGVFEYLELNPIEVESENRPSDDRPYAERIVNWDEVYNLLVNSDFSHYLKESLYSK